jgi:uncharacterized protein
MCFRLLPPAWLLFGAMMSAHAFGACGTGSYALAGGGYVDIAPATGAELRWRMTDGTTGALARGPGEVWTSTMGWTGRADGKRVSFDCARDAIDFDGTRGERIDFDVVETRFDVEGASLAGRLVMPKGDERVPVVVLVHGAELTSARDGYALQRMVPSSGIGAFVYDKRGTGGSSGAYTHDYLTLAVDAIAAAHEARRLAGDRVGRIGYQAGSQGGWVAPLAAGIEPVDFIVVGFGLAVAPLRAERELLAMDMTRQGYGREVVEKAMQVADAVDAVVVSNFQSGYDRLAAVRRKYQQEPWFEHIQGSITAMLFETPPEKLRIDGPKLVPSIPFHYDPMPVLRNLDTPQLWILGGDDVVAPAPETSHRLTALAKAGKPITTAIFPDADHGIYEYETAPDGTRISTRASAGYFMMMRDFILEGRIAGDYGGEILSRGSPR